MKNGTIEKLIALGAATIHEAQGAKGALDSGIKPIDPSSRLAGPAVTVDIRPADNLMLHYALTKVCPGDVLVVDAKGFIEAGPWGDVMTHAAMKLGVAGLVINGAVRDASQIVEMGFPVFCRGLSIKGTAKNQPGKVNVPICIGDVLINHGDYVVGDRDGVVIVPTNEVEATLNSAAAREEKEAAFRRELDQGRTTVELLGLAETLKRLGLD
ncbi:4-carboxy-4-hydroxy-2-oxoadipate aldolase/oxaloacetate decarboxylase [Bradyrhizobium sp. Leo121]|uniref:4-carboxy-4-hydroxy-2-oxoadipate aldolase/oxaloacetate decarboxylase n=1 Tax=Bradyrhizobium sp. Leo121 TaxID=1571195 RepID=UPI001028B94F|nr:4-carboxy-4-hydroxy-2-oxoadipate aldolase/oxaloacetate decarboxylase [Bradyrhizobium sp. Leo121]RZN34513.1 4-hydroxy-4-methyl-2-oxoglutarate aldolase [Bradyrhizobium sp. Leo121]